MLFDQQKGGCSKWCFRQTLGLSWFNQQRMNYFDHRHGHLCTKWPSNGIFLNIHNINNNIHFRVDSLVLQMVICWSGQVLSYFGMISTKQIRNSSTTHFKHVHQWIFCLFRNERTCDEQTENHHGMCVVCVLFLLGQHWFGWSLFVRHQCRVWISHDVKYQLHPAKNEQCRGMLQPRHSTRSCDQGLRQLQDVRGW